MSVQIEVTTGTNEISITDPSGYSQNDIENIVDSLLIAGDKLSWTYNDANDTLTIDTTALDEEGVEDAVSSLVTAGNAITATYDDGANTLTVAVDESVISHDNITDISSSDHHAKYTDEEVRDVIGTALTAGNNVSVTLDDNGDTITISASDEDIQDVVDALVIAGNAINLTYDDNADTLTISTTAIEDVVEDASPKLGGNLDVNEKSIGDGDNDTRVEFEESTDEDIIRFYVNGIEALNID